MTSEIRERLESYAIAYLRIYGEAPLKDVIDSFIRMYPEMGQKYTVPTLRNKLTRTITADIKYYGERANIQRTPRKTLTLREGFTWQED